MPRKPINYSNTIIYKLVCNDVEIKEIYVGHTTDFVNRKRNHKQSCNNPNDKAYDVYVYQFIRQTGGWTNWSMLEICKISCVDVYDAERNERKYIEELKSTLNSKIPTRTRKEYREQNKEQILEHKKEYYEQNKEQIHKKQKEYREHHREHLLEYSKTNMICECGVELTLSSKSRHLKSKKHINLLTK
jgi:hypothetical protein